MDENNKTRLSEEQLTEIGGGNLASNPVISYQCWFKGDGGPREDGRTKCITECKGKFDEDGPTYPTYDGEWHICYCWGTDNCIDKWHKPCGNPKRFY